MRYERVKVIADLVNQGMKSKDIAESTGWKRNYVNEARRQAVRMGLCAHGHIRTPVVGRMETKIGVMEVRFRSIYQAGLAGYDRACIWECINGTQATHAGYTWERA